MNIEWFLQVFSIHGQATYLASSEVRVTHAGSWGEQNFKLQTVLANATICDIGSIIYSNYIDIIY
jgi:hypothetical protein